MNLVHVYSSVSLNEVNYVRSFLESNGIEAVVFDEATAAIAPHYLFPQGGAKVMVREEDAAQARALIRDYETSKAEGNGPGEQ